MIQPLQCLSRIRIARQYRTLDSFLSELFRKIRQHLGYFDLLRANLLTRAALKTGSRLLFRRQGAQRHGRDESAAGIGVLVVEAQQMRNIQTHRAMAYTVMAGRAGHRAGREHLLCNAQQGLHFFLVKLSVNRERSEVFFKLLLVRHAGQTMPTASSSISIFS